MKTKKIAEIIKSHLKDREISYEIAKISDDLIIIKDFDSNASICISNGLVEISFKDMQPESKEDVEKILSLLPSMASR